MDTLSEHEDKASDKDNIKPLDIADAAVLMAVDGYGESMVKGNTASGIKVIKTSDKVMHIDLPHDATDEMLYAEAHKRFSQMVSNRDMRHD